MKHAVDRRTLLAALLGAVAGAACSAGPVKPVEPKLEPLALEKLDALATSAGMVWMIRAKPRNIAQIPFLIPAIARIVPEARFDAFRDKIGLDPRSVLETIWIRYGEALKNAEVELVRHDVDPAMIERKFFARLTSEPQRVQDRPDVVRVYGVIGRTRHGFLRMGRDVAAYQQRGDEQRGPVAIASLFARGKLTKAPRLLGAEPLSSLAARFGEAPIVALALGPFTDEWKAAARGLLEIATAVGAAARPTARENIGLAVALSGGFGADGPKAADVLRMAWDDIALTPMGHLLGFDHPVQEPVTSGDKGIVQLSVEIAPDRLTEGLKALAEQDLDAIMRLD